MLIVTQDHDQFDYASKGMYTRHIAPVVGYTIFSGAPGDKGATVLATYRTLQQCATVMQAIGLAYARGNHHYVMPGYHLDGWEDWEILKESMREDEN